jgi:hypothetical protein
MQHINYVLKPATIDNAKPKDKRYDLTDGGGLVLEVTPSGSKTWRFKYHLNGKREKATIGAYPAFTIKQARDRHDRVGLVPPAFALRSGGCPPRVERSEVRIALPSRGFVARHRRRLRRPHRSVHRAGSTAVYALCERPRGDASHK